MKTNGNNSKIKDYYIGLDVGTNSVGWAVTDKNYNILKFKGNAMWGARLFDEAQDASDRRAARTSRRLLNRKKQSLALLELLFNNEIAKIDPSFFIRMHESSLYSEDKSDSACKYSLFNDANFTDKDYLKKYPTVYHLRNELIKSTDYHDPRLVYLAVHHIVKSRGHFLFEMEVGDDYKNIYEMIDELNFVLNDRFGSAITFLNRERFIDVLTDEALSVTAKKKALKECVVYEKDDEDSVNIFALTDALAGATVKLADLFCDDGLKDAEKKSVCLKADLDADFDLLSEAIGDSVDLIVSMKTVFDSARLSQILNNREYISEAKIDLFNENKKDLSALKSCVKENAKGKYKHIFSEKAKKLNNFAAYSKYSTQSGEYTCGQEDFCKFLEKELPELSNDEKYAGIYEKIRNKTFLTKLKGSDNSVIPNQLHLKELKKILENAGGYLTFLNEKDADGLTVKEKIISIFTFRIPYYVGPLNTASDKAWLERTDEKIYPWNFEKTVDIEKSAERFMTNLIGRCTYTGDYVLPKDSLLYSEYMLLNEINKLSVNGNPLPVDVKNQLVTDLFKNSNARVTKKSIKEHLRRLGLVEQHDEIAGIDDTVKAKLKSYHDFRKILDKTHDTETVEEIIERILVFGDDKKLLKKWLKANCKTLDDSDIAYICRLKYKDWGRLSKTFLTEIYTPDENGEAHSVIDMLRNTNCNLMQLLSDKYQFADNAKAYMNEKYPTASGIKEQINSLYVSPMIKRSILQTLKIVDEIVDIQKSAPKKIFIEVARGTKENLKGKRTSSRKDKLIELYKACGEDSGLLFDALQNTDESRLRHDALYLYYTQFGKCMYSGQEIYIEEIDKNYDVDHIFPQSRIKDDSLQNRVLVSKKYNEEKGNVYPIKAEWQNKMKPFWNMLKEKGFINDEKYIRLTRTMPLTAEELSSFVARQLVETQQSTKALAELLDKTYKDTKIVYSKANNVSDFRDKKGFTKCREINDLHHAKDAYLNVVVGNVYDTKFTEKFFLNIDKEKYSLNQVFNYNVDGAWDKKISMVTVKKHMAKNNIIVTRRPYEAKGSIFDLQIMPAGKGQLPVKEGKDIQKYGGYNKISGAYFFVAEHLYKKSRIRTIEPVYIYKKSLYESDPIKYCKEILGLVEPRIVCKKILMDQVLSLDGKSVCISGRTGDRLLCKHNYQLILDSNSETYLKALSKYVDRCNEAKRELAIYSRDLVNNSENMKLYNALTEKMKAAVYYQFFASACDTLIAKKENFSELSTLDQCRVLLEILKLFKCDRQTADLSLIGGANNIGNIRSGKNLNKLNKAYLINKSVTGLFETEIDLLK